LCLRYEQRGQYSQYFNDADVELIRQCNLSFLIRIGFNIIRGDILNSARYGIWSMHFDDEEKYRGGPPCFWEIYHRDQSTGAILQRLTDRLDGGIVLRKAFFPTAMHSYRLNYNQVALGSATWPVDVCRDIVTGHADYIDGPSSATVAPIFRNPSNRDMMRFAARIARQYIARAQPNDTQPGVKPKPASPR
jgi:methionyl-tRNA formyltransferase